MILSQRIFICIGLVMIFLSCQSTDKKEQKEQITIGTTTEKDTQEELGKELFYGKGKCASCHQPNKQSIGPSISEIIKIYQEKDGDLIGFLKQEQEPIVDPENYAVMKTNFALLKTFSDEELHRLTAYMKQLSQ